MRQRGPDRVIIDLDGTAIPAKRWPGRVDFILVRNDGWSIGGPAGLYEAARALWLGDWLAVIRRPSPSVEMTIWFPGAA